MQTDAHTFPFPTFPSAHHRRNGQSSKSAVSLSLPTFPSAHHPKFEPKRDTRRNRKVKLKSKRRRLGGHPPPTPMDAPRGGGGGHTRRPGISGAAADQRRAAAAQAMARMEEMMLAHAGAAGEFSIILDAPLPSLQQYRRNPAPPSAAPSISKTNTSPLRRVAQGGGGRDDGVPARLRRDGSGHDALGDPDTAARTSRRGAVDGTGAGAARPRAGGARREREQEETVEAPVRLTDPRSVRRPVSRGATPPPRSTEVRRAAAQEEEERAVRREHEQEDTVEAPVRLTDPRSVRKPVSRGATPPSRSTEVRRVAVQEEEERAVRREREQEETVEAPVRLTDPRSVRRPVSRGATPPPRSRVAAQEEEEETPLQLLARGGRSSSTTRPAEVPQATVAPQASEAVAAASLPATRPSSRRSRRDVGVKQVVSEVASSVDSDVESIGRWSSRGSDDGGDEAVLLPRPLAAVVARDRSRSNSPAISNVKDDSLPFVISSKLFDIDTTKNLASSKKETSLEKVSLCFEMRRFVLIFKL